MAALIQRQQEAQLATLQAAAEMIGSEKTLEKVVRSLVRAAMQHHRENDLLASAIDHEEARLPVDALLSSYLEKAGAVVEVMLERFQHEIPSIMPKVAARTLPALVRSVTDAWANLRPPQLEKAEEEAVRAVLGYLRIGGE